MFHTAKIQNWKQFTTNQAIYGFAGALCFTLQRYKIESNSQLLIFIRHFFISCVSHCKDTKLKAIHNVPLVIAKVGVVVFHTAKIQNWKQFTTNGYTFWYSEQLCFTLQRYKIESNSQLLVGPSRLVRCCVLHCKDTKLKAIHNQQVRPCNANKLCFTLQRYKIESNSQRLLSIPFFANCCVLHCKDTKLKAIHNISPDSRAATTVVFYTAKIQNWKQFTTMTKTVIITCRLCFTLQRYKIESNSQHLVFLFQLPRSCVLHCKDTKLKAIHNLLFILIILL